MALRRRTPVRRLAMTLVEVMVAMAVFVIALLSVIGLFIFNMKTMDQVRANTQITQILIHELEAMRMRTWDDRLVSSAPGGVLYGIKSLGMGQAGGGSGALLSGVNTDNEKCQWYWQSFPTSSGAAYTISPFAIYGTPISVAKSGKVVAVVGEDVAKGALQMRINQANLSFQRYVYLYKSDYLDPAVVDPDMAYIYVYASWSDERGSHTKGVYTTVSKYGINDYVVRSVPDGA